MLAAAGWPLAYWLLTPYLLRLDLRVRSSGALVVFSLSSQGGCRDEHLKDWGFKNSGTKRVAAAPAGKQKESKQLTLRDAAVPPSSMCVSAEGATSGQKCVWHPSHAECQAALRQQRGLRAP